jgi:uncharacterized membrane protein
MPAVDTTRTSREDARRDLLTPALVLALLVGLVVFLVAAPGTYAVLKTLHILAAVVWVGGGLTLIVLAILYERRRDQEGLFAVARQAEWIGTRVFTPASFITLAFGIAAVVEGDWDFGSAWIVIGLVGWAASAFVGIALITPRVKRLGAVTPDRFDDPEVHERVADVMRIARIDSVILTLVIVDMAAKPFL